MNRIVDASVVLKVLLPEPGTDLAAALLREPVLAPEILVPECLNALRKAVLRGRLTRGEGREAARLLMHADIALESTRDLAEDAFALSLQLSLTAYDCMYLALGRRRGGVVVTADERLVVRCRQADAKALGLRVESIHDTPAVSERPVRGYMVRRKPAPARAGRAGASSA